MFDVLGARRYWSTTICPILFFSQCCSVWINTGALMPVAQIWMSDAKLSPDSKVIAVALTDLTLDDVSASIWQAFTAWIAASILCWSCPASNELPASIMRILMCCAVFSKRLRPWNYGRRWGTRTPDPLIKSQLKYFLNIFENPWKCLYLQGFPWSITFI